MGFQLLADVPRQQASARGERLAFQFESRRTTFSQWDSLSNQAANALLDSGVGRQARVGYLGKNSDVFFHLLFGCAKTGVVLTPINWRLAVPEICFILKDSGCEALFVGPEFVPHVAAIRRECPSLERVVATEPTSSDLPTIDQWLADRSEVDPRSPIASDDVVLQLYTSGTTGLPKGALLTHRNLLFPTDLSRTELFGNWREDDICVLPMPLFHAAGVVFGLNAPCAGGTAIIVREAQPGLILEAAEASPGPVTRMGIVPAILRPILDHPAFVAKNFSALRTLTYGGSPIAPELLRAGIAAFGPVMLQLFGMTETATMGTLLLPSDHDPNNPARLMSCGRPVPGVEMRIALTDGGEAAAGQSGEIWIRSDAVMAGYWNRPEDTIAALAGGWYHTGDVGYRDEQGYIYVQDRLKDMIISGGENVYPAEVERVLAEHASVADVAVFGVPDEKWGETVKAAIVVRPGAQVSETDLLGFARERLGGFKCPSSFDFMSQLPRNASGKLLKRVLKEPYWAGRNRNVG